jgi:hypothetical protein
MLAMRGIVVVDALLTGGLGSRVNRFLLLVLEW